MTRVLKLNADNTATISTEGLRMVVIQPENKVIWELCDQNDAEAYAKTFNQCNPGGEHRAEILDYAEAYRRQELAT